MVAGSYTLTLMHRSLPSMERWLSKAVLPAGSPGASALGSLLYTVFPCGPLAGFGGICLELLLFLHYFRGVSPPSHPKGSLVKLNISPL